VPQDRDANLKLLSEAGSLQLNLEFANGNPGILIVDKGDTGRGVFDKAFAAWRSKPSAQ
jgi:hypothetical protein